MDHDAEARRWLESAPFPIPSEHREAAAAWLAAALRSASSVEPTHTDRLMLQLGRLRGDFVEALERHGVASTPENVGAVLKLAEEVMLEGGTVVADDLAARFARTPKM